MSMLSRRDMGLLIGAADNVDDPVNNVRGKITGSDWHRRLCCPSIGPRIVCLNSRSITPVAAITAATDRIKYLVYRYDS